MQDLFCNHINSREDKF